MKQLLKEFIKNSNARYRTILAEKDRLYSLDMAVVWASAPDVDKDKRAEIWDNLISKYPNNIRVITEYFHSNSNISDSGKKMVLTLVDNILANDIDGFVPSLNELAKHFAEDMGFYDKAIEILKRIIDKNKNDYIAVITLASILIKSNNLSDARLDLQKTDAANLLLEIINSDQSIPAYTKARAYVLLAMLYGKNHLLFNKTIADIIQIYESAINIMLDINSHKTDIDSCKRALANFLSALSIQSSTPSADAERYADQAINILESQVTADSITRSMLARLYGSQKCPRYNVEKAYHYYYLLFPILNKVTWSKLPSTQPDSQILFAQFLMQHGELEKSEQLFNNMLNKGSHAKKAREGLDELSSLRNLNMTAETYKYMMNDAGAYLDSSGYERTRDFKKRIREKSVKKHN